MPAIRSFIFDIGNVLIPFDFDRAVRRIAPHSDCAFETLPPGVKPITEAYESGQISRAEFLRQVIALFQYRGTEADFVTAWAEIFVENHAMTCLVRQLHGRYPLYLLSNTSDIHLDYFQVQYPVFQYFSDGVYSHIAGCIKPHPRIFEIAIRQFGVEPAATVYIDDLPANVAAAKALGFAAIQYDHTRHGCLVEQLTALGITGLGESV